MLYRNRAIPHTPINHPCHQAAYLASIHLIITKKHLRFGNNQCITI